MEMVFAKPSGNPIIHNHAIVFQHQTIAAFSNAKVAAKPLFGAQQIPGNDPALRAADVSFSGSNYARTEIVKASSALTAADQVLQHLIQSGLLSDNLAEKKNHGHYFPVTQQLDHNDVTDKAMAIALQRGYPAALAKTL